MPMPAEGLVHPIARARGPGLITQHVDHPAEVYSPSPPITLPAAPGDQEDGPIRRCRRERRRLSQTRRVGDGGADDPAPCPTCGRPVAEHSRHVRFRLPDPVVRLPEREATEGTWMSHPDANEAVLLQVPGAGPFCRCLLPVRLDGGYTLHLGVWVGVHPDDLQRAFRVWWTPEYERLELHGHLANALPGWGALGAPVRAVVRDPDHTPYVVSSSDEALAAVLEREWPHEEVLARLA
jgi:hypothetical protein